MNERVEGVPQGQEGWQGEKSATKTGQWVMVSWKGCSPGVKEKGEGGESGRKREGEWIRKAFSPVVASALGKNVLKLGDI